MQPRSLSRHCYALDEVYAALSYSCTRNEPSEAVYWCRELLDSGCVMNTVASLFQTWLWDKGPYALGWLLDSGRRMAAEEVTEEGIVCAADRLRACYAMRDHSLWNILYLDLYATTCDRVTPKTPAAFALSLGWSDADRFVARALYQGKAQSAWYVVRRQYTTEQWDRLVDAYVAGVLFNEDHVEIQHCIHVLRAYETLLGERSEGADQVIRCLTVLILSLSPEQRAASLLRGRGDRVDPMVRSKGSRRALSPPTLCLYGHTRRGRMKWTEHTRRDLFCVEPGFLGCPYWEEAIEPYCHGVDRVVDGRLQWNSEDAMETFYRMAFPQEIPDEWTLDEKKISHGDGVLGPNDSVLFSKYVRMHFGRCSRLAWNTGPEVQKRLMANEPVFPLGASMIEMYEKETKAHAVVSEVNWTPLRRKVVF